MRMMKPRRIRWVGHVACLGEVRNAYKGLVGRTEGKRPSRRYRHTCGADIKMDFKEMGWEGVG
jgi:hypothetical protein